MTMKNLLAVTLALIWVSLPAQSHAKEKSYCEEMAAIKGDAIEYVDSETLRKSNRVFYAAIEIGGYDVKGSLFEIHDWAPSGGGLIVPCEIAAARIKIPLRHDEQDDDASEDAAIAVSEAMDNLSHYRPRIIKILAGASVVREASWSDLKRQIEWRTGLVPLQLSDKQELIYSILSDIHIPRADVCAGDAVWNGGTQDRLSSECRKLVCEDYHGRFFLEERAALCGDTPKPIPHLDRIKILNQALLEEEFRYIYGNLGSTGMLVGFVSENLKGADVIRYPGVREIARKNYPPAQITSRLLDELTMPTEHAEGRIEAGAGLNAWFEKYRREIGKTQGIRIVGGNAWLYAIASNPDAAANAYGSLQEMPTTWICAKAPGRNIDLLLNSPHNAVLVSKQTPLTLSDIEHRIETSTALRAIEAGGKSGTTDRERYQALLSELKGLRWNTPEYRALLDQLDLIVNKLGMMGDRERYLTLLKSTEAFLQSIQRRAKANNIDWSGADGCEAHFPTTASGSWVRGFVSTLDPRNEPSIRK